MLACAQQQHDLSYSTPLWLFHQTTYIYMLLHAKQITSYEGPNNRLTSSINVHKNTKITCFFLATLQSWPGATQHTMTATIKHYSLSNKSFNQSTSNKLLGKQVTLKHWRHSTPPIKHHKVAVTLNTCSCSRGGTCSYMPSVRDATAPIKTPQTCSQRWHLHFHALW